MPTQYPETLPPYRPGFPTAPPRGYPERGGFPTTQAPEDDKEDERPSYPTPGYSTQPPVTGYTEKPGVPSQPPPELYDRNDSPTTEQSIQTDGPRPTYPPGPSTEGVTEGTEGPSERPGYPIQLLPTGKRKLYNNYNSPLYLYK